MLKYKWVVLMGIIMVLLSSCKDKTTNNQDVTPFSLTVNLTNNQGEHLSGYRIGFCPVDSTLWEGENGGRSYVHIRFDLAATQKVKLEVLDYFDQPIKELVDDSLNAGAHTVVWNGRDSLSNPVNRDGIYKMKLTCRDQSNHVTYTSTEYAYQLCWINEAQTPYRLDDTGSLRLTDILPYPVLYCTEELKHMDEQLNQVGTISLTDNFHVYICRDDSLGNLQEIRGKDFRIHQGANVLNLNWDTLSRQSVTQGNRGHASRTMVNETKDVPTYETRLFPPYPNPFN